jgi:hypothetical protein
MGATIVANIKEMAFKKLAGVLLIVVAVGMLAFWEAKGREMILMDEVVVAAEDIRASEPITKSMLTTVKVPLNAKVSGVVYAKNEGEAVGLIATATIPKGAQLSDKLLSRSQRDGEAGRSYFVIKSGWIYMCSSALRQGDEIEIVSADGTRAFGNFKVAFVKDNENDEIASRAEESVGLGDSSFDARGGGANVDHIEIVTDLSAYMAIKTFAETTEEPALIIVQKRS